MSKNINNGRKYGCGIFLLRRFIDVAAIYPITPSSPWPKILTNGLRRENQSFWSKVNVVQLHLAMLAAGNVQEAMDMSGISHLCALRGVFRFTLLRRFRTSYEIQKSKLLIMIFTNSLYTEASKVQKNALNPEHPVIRGPVRNPDIFFQARVPNFYNALLPLSRII